MKPFILVVAATVLGASAGVVGSFSGDGRRGTARAAVSPTAAAKVGPDDARLARIALKQLDALRTAVEIDAPLPDYAEKVAGAKTKLHAAVDEIRSADELKAPLRDAMNAHAAALDFRRHCVEKGDRDKDGLAPMTVGQLEGYRPYGVSLAPTDGVQTRVKKGEVRKIWAFAAEKTREARRALASAE